jgi:hypothetical protein
MNIVVIGSCTDSSTLAKELNKRLHDSIVARVDLLKNLKQLIFQDLNVVTTTENIGTYVGDVETYDYSKVPADQKQQIINTLESITKNLKSFKNKQLGYGSTGVSTFDALTNSLPTGTYSFIKVYSGAIDDDRLARFVNDQTFISSSVFIKLSTPSESLLPINVSEKVIDDIKKNAFAFVECDKVNDVFTSEVFQLLFELTNEKEITPSGVEAKEVILQEEFVVNAEPEMDMAA